MQQINHLNSKSVSDILLFTISCGMLVEGNFKTIEYKRRQITSSSFTLAFQKHFKHQIRLAMMPLSTSLIVRPDATSASERFHIQRLDLISWLLSTWRSALHLFTTYILILIQACSWLHFKTEMIQLNWSLNDVFIKVTFHISTGIGNWFQ